MRKTAMSSIIYEVLDMGTGITDADGELATSGAGIPGFVGVLDKAVKAILERHEPGDIRPGDVFVTNDPFYGGVTHLNDIDPGHAGVRRRATGRLDREHRPLQRRRRHGPGSISNDATRDLPGGPAAARDQADRRGASRSGPSSTS